jgi:serine/threonine-protein kinase RsbW
MIEPLETAIETLDSKLDNIDSAENLILEVAQRAGFRGDELEKVGLAVREVVANAIIHGNRLDEQKKVVVTALRTPGQLKVAVWDQGKGFDLDGVADPRSPEVLLKESGRGIYMARAFMDRFDVETGPAGGTTVSLVKYIAKSRNVEQEPAYAGGQAVAS